MLLGHGETGGAHHPLGAAAVDDHRAGAHEMGLFFKVGDGGGGIGRQQDQVAGGKLVIGERAVYRAAELSEFLSAGIGVKGQHLPARFVIGFGKGTADQPQAENPDYHCTASRTERTFLARASYSSGRRDWAPSHRA